MYYLFQLHKIYFEGNGCLDVTKLFGNYCLNCLLNYTFVILVKNRIKD